MKSKIKRVMMLAAVPLVLLGCATDTADPTEPAETEEPEEREEVQISNVQVNVESGITEAVEEVDGAVV
ncbi:MAG TPA: hypothetical protein VK048_02775, partial [Atopostipes sp.]|nr:hypothetical protein [Atopostipes sp.]